MRMDAEASVIHLEYSHRCTNIQHTNDIIEQCSHLLSFFAMLPESVLPSNARFLSAMGVDRRRVTVQ